MENKYITIKEIENNRYSISLVQARNHLYYVVYGLTNDGVIRQSEGIKDYSIASYLFDLKIKDLECH